MSTASSSPPPAQANSAPAADSVTATPAGDVGDPASSSAGAIAGAQADSSGDAFWSREDDEVLLSGLEEGSKAGKQSGAGWKPEVWAALIVNLAPIRQRGAVKTVDNSKSHFRN
ncbi:unnamed protein product, partial [Tilletia controversa]